MRSTTGEHRLQPASARFASPAVAARWAVVAWLLLIGSGTVRSAQEEARQSDDYALTAETMDGGGRYASSTHYGMDSSLGSIVGVSSTTVPAQAALHGYIGQLYEVISLGLQASPEIIPARGVSQLSGTAILDDGTLLALLGADLAWAPAVAPLASISPSGLATAENVIAGTLANFSAVYRSVTGTGTLVVEAATPIAATILAFTAVPNGNGVALAWTTGVEFDLLGFHVERQDAGGDWVRISPWIIPANGSGRPEDYALEDARGPTLVPVRYRLVEVDLRGRTHVVATTLAQRPMRIWIRRDDLGLEIAVQGPATHAILLETTTTVVDRTWTPFRRLFLDTNGAGAVVVTPDSFETSRFYRARFERPLPFGNGTPAR